MRRFALLALLAALVLGCSSSPEPVVQQDDTRPAPPVGAEKKTGTAPVDPPQFDPQATDPRYNSSRVYQLSELRVVDLQVGSHKFKAWVMDTPGKRQEGMMFLQPDKVQENEAMLFVFPEPQPLSFWMQNTPCPLDIAYVTKGKKLLNVQPGKPYDEGPLPSDADAQYVVEVKQGTFKRLGIKRGADVKFPADIVGR